MLAANATMEDFVYPLLASPKLDGVRGLVIHGTLFSRSLKPIPNPWVTSLFSRSELTGYDGELIFGSPTAKDVYRQTISAVSREYGEPNVKFYVFDNFEEPGGYKFRLGILQRNVIKLQAADGVVLHEQMLIKCQADLEAYEAECLELGYEGLITRDPNEVYKFGRSTVREGGMLKLKRFIDSEAVILDVEEEMENTNEKVTNELGRGQRSSCNAGLLPKGRAGTLCVRDVKTNIEFRIGSGLNDIDRAFFWENRKKVVGKLVKYKFFPVGIKEKPRHPVYLGGRETWDLS